MRGSDLAATLRASVINSSVFLSSRRGGTLEIVETLADLRVARPADTHDPRLADVAEPTTLRARLGHARRIHPSMQPAGGIDDPRGAEKL
jgi:hypothetical protein